MSPAILAASADLALMRRIAQGDALAYRELLDSNLKSILNYAFRMLHDREEAEEVAQETFLRAWQNAQGYEPRAKVSTWLHTIAHHLAVDRLRRRRETRGGDLIEEVPASGRPSGYLEEKRTALNVQAALEALPERQKTAIALVHYQGLSNPEAAQVMGLGLEAVESLLSRARQKLRTLLERAGGRSDD